MCVNRYKTWCFLDILPLKFYFTLGEMCNTFYFWTYIYILLVPTYKGLTHSWVLTTDSFWSKNTIKWNESILSYSFYISTGSIWIMVNLTLAAGTGSLIILGIWVTIFVLCCLSLRTQHNLTPFAFIIAVLITTSLLLIPRGEIKTSPSVGIVSN